MATTRSALGQQPGGAPPIVLPITSRGLAVTDRLCWGFLGVAMAVSAALTLYLNRGTTYFFDELAWLLRSPELGPGDVFEPHNGHLIATTRVVYKGILETLGTGYLPFRLLAVSTVLLSAGLFYALVKRRVGALPALAPTLVLLFFGSAWQHVLVPVGFTIVFSVAAGLGALLALERDDRRGDLAACALLVVSVATYTTGLPFVVGVAVSVLLRPDRRRRAWVFLVPLALYAAWWLWSLSADHSAQEETKLSNVLLIPNWIADSLATVTAALIGLDYNFTAQFSSAPNPEWGRALAVIPVAALAWRIQRGNVPRSVWVSLGIVLGYWALIALGAGPTRVPEATRYMYLGAVGVLLVASAAATGIRFSKLGLAALFAVCLVSLAGNLALLRDGGRIFREGSRGVGAELAMLDLARPHVDPNLDLSQAPERLSPLLLFGTRAANYYAVVDRYGSPAPAPDEVERQPEDVRRASDQFLARVLGLTLTPAPRSLRQCERLRSDQGAPVGFELPAGGASIGVAGGRSGTVTAGRFADSPSAEVGTVSSAEPAALRVPPDASPVPWRAAVTGARSVEVCALR
jgi:hypothetical protein